MKKLIKIDMSLGRGDLPRSLRALGHDIRMEKLPAGDIIVPNGLTIGILSAAPFVRLIHRKQIDGYCRNWLHTDAALLIIQGNPYDAAGKLPVGTIRNAIIRLLGTWQFPIMRSRNSEDTAAIIDTLARQQYPQMLQQSPRHKLFTATEPEAVLQALPGVGPAMAYRILEHFNDLLSFMTADENEMANVKGLSHRSARRIREVLTSSTQPAMAPRLASAS